MILGTPFKHAHLSVVLLIGLFTASSCTTLTTNNQSITGGQQLALTEPAIVEISDTKLGGANKLAIANWTKNIEGCSATYKKLVEPEINNFSTKVLTYDKLFANDSNLLALINQLSQDESLQCKEQALTVIAQMSQLKAEAAQTELKKNDIYAPIQREAIANLLSAQQALLLSYVRHGLITNDEQDVQLWLQAHDIWTSWLNQPVAFADADEMVTTLMTNKVLISTVTELTNYLTDYKTELDLHPNKSELILNQTLIYLAQAEDNNRRVQQTLDKVADSLPWLKKMTNELSPTKPSTNKMAKELSVTDTEKALLEVLERDETQYFTQLLKLSEIRYKNFSEVKLLESAKTFLTEEVEDLAFSQLLAAMDYAKMGDKVSSKRWLDRAFSHQDIAQEICQIQTLNPEKTNPFFKQKNGQWLLTEIHKQCQ